MKTNNKVFFAVDVMMKSKGRVSQITIVKQTEGKLYWGPVRIPVPAARDWTTYRQRRPEAQNRTNFGITPYVDPAFSDVRRATKYFQSNGTIPR